MTFLALQPLTVALLPAALELDRRCFGGLWTLDSYRRELESPNSELLILIEEPGVRSQEPGNGIGSISEAGANTVRRSQEYNGEKGGEGKKDRLLTPDHQQFTTLSTQNSFPSSLSPPPSPPLLGLGCYWAILEEAHITMLAIDPAHQRQGLGQALLSALMSSAHARGLERATLEVRVSNHAARALYQKFDFSEAGRRRRYYPDDGEDALVLWRGGIQTPEFSKRLKSWQQQVCDRLCVSGWQSTVD